MTSDESLVRLDEALVDELIAIGPRVLGQLRAKFSNVSVDEVEEAMQTALFRFWVTRETYDPNKLSLSGWIYVLARNALLDRLRVLKEGRLRFVDAGLLDVMQREVAEPEPSGHTADQDSIAMRLELALSALSTADRDLLRHWVNHRDSGKWAQEIADQIGSTPGAVRVRRIRLINRLRRELEHGFPPLDKSLADKGSEL
ncbi:MAG: sigma-70 family RNA polymerase sigma factor [Planctomycetaceae bacterium]